MFHAVAGRRPFEDGDPKAADLADRFPQIATAPHPLPDKVPTEVAAVVRAALEPNPADRPDPHEVAEALQPARASAAGPAGRLQGQPLNR